MLADPGLDGIPNDLIVLTDQTRWEGWSVLVPVVAWGSGYGGRLELLDQARNDELIGVPNAEELSDAIPDVEVVTVNGGHVPDSET
ncbi:MAG: hypothetical protein WD029_05965 [Microthrixaceae bacterium]